MLKCAASLSPKERGKHPRITLSDIPDDENVSLPTNAERRSLQDQLPCLRHMRFSPLRGAGQIFQWLTPTGRTMGGNDLISHDSQPRPSLADFFDDTNVDHDVGEDVVGPPVAQWDVLPPGAAAAIENFQCQENCHATFSKYQIVNLDSSDDECNLTVIKTALYSFFHLEVITYLTLMMWLVSTQMKCCMTFLPISIWIM